MVSFLKNSLPEKIILCLMSLLAIIPIRFLVNYLLFPFPLGYRDGAPILEAMVLHQGGNPYLLANFPEKMYVYGPIYPIMIMPWINLIHPVMLIPRLICVFSLILSVILFYALLRSQKVSILGAFAGSMIMGNALCLVIKINSAGPDLPAFFFMIFGMYILQKTGLAFRGLLLSAILAVVCFYIKEYFIIPFLLFSVYLVLFQPKPKGLVYVGSMAFLLLISAFILRWTCPLYFRYTILHHLNMFSNDFGHLVMQLTAFVTWYAILLILVLGSVVLKSLRRIRSGNRRFGIDFRSWEKPIIEGVEIDIYVAGFILMMIIMIFSIGRNAGNTHTYFQELPLPLLIIAGFSFIAQEIRKSIIKNALYIACLVSLVPLCVGYQINFEKYAEAFQLLEKRADQCQVIYGSPMMDIYLINRNQDPIYNSGHTDFATTVLYAKNPWIQKILGGNDGQIENKWITWSEMLGAKVKNQEFDCIIVDRQTTRLGYSSISDYYELETVIPEVMEWDVISYKIVVDAFIWIPRK
jgi:hypothetical protein